MHLPAIRRPRPQVALPALARPLRRPIDNLVELAGLIRRRLTDTLRGHPEQPSAPDHPDAVVMSAAAPFAPTSFARARLLRQMHAAGLLSARETEQAEHLFGVAQSG
jgi:hypothetical protein